MHFDGLVLGCHDALFYDAPDDDDDPADDDDDEDEAEFAPIGWSPRGFIIIVAFFNV